jgi:hypothetical protein
VQEVTPHSTGVLLPHREANEDAIRKPVIMCISRHKLSILTGFDNQCVYELKEEHSMSSIVDWKFKYSGESPSEVTFLFINLSKTNGQAKSTGMWAATSLVYLLFVNTA